MNIRHTGRAIGGAILLAGLSNAFAANAYVTHIWLADVQSGGRSS
jgi:hypothetical protein